MNKDVEIEILIFLSSSKDYWTDIFKVIDRNKTSYVQYAILLEEMVKDGYIIMRKEADISSLKITIKDELALGLDLTSRITEKGENHLSKHSTIKESGKKTSNKENTLIKNYYYVIGSIFLTISAYFLLKEKSGLDVLEWIQSIFNEK